jgi:hypothetical protein
VFQIGQIYLGPEHDRSWARAAVTRVYQLVEGRITGPGTVRLLFHVGGATSEPAWIGPARPQRRGSVVGFDVGVPASIHDDALETRLLDFTEEAMRTAAATCRAKGVFFDEEGHERVITTARNALAELAPVSERRRAYHDATKRAARYRARHGTPDAYAEPRAQARTIRVEFRWNDQHDLDELFALEDRVEEALVSAGVGEVDGNDVGSSSYTLFVVPNLRGAQRARELVASQITAARLDGLVAGPAWFKRTNIDRRAPAGESEALEP